MKFTMNEVLVQCRKSLQRKPRVADGHFQVLGFPRRMVRFAKALTSRRSIHKLSKANILSSYGGSTKSIFGLVYVTNLDMNMVYVLMPLDKPMRKNLVLIMLF